MDWRGEVTRIASELSIPLKWDNQEALKQVEDFIDPALRHHTATPAPDTGKNPAIVLAARCYDLLKMSGHPDGAASELDDIGKKFNEIVEIIMPWDRQNIRLNKAKAELAASNLQLTADLERLTAELGRIKHTISWRVTKPFRFAYNKACKR
jgi:hypothetical protein